MEGKRKVLVRRRGAVTILEDLGFFIDRSGLLDQLNHLHVDRTLGKRAATSPSTAPANRCEAATSTICSSRGSRATVAFQAAWKW